MLVLIKNVIGKMKNEFGKGDMSEFIAISHKVYAYKQIQVDGTLSKDKKARGTSKIVTKKTLCFDNYKNCSTTKLLNAYNIG